MNIQYKWLILLLIFGCIACESDDETPVDGEEKKKEVVITSGEADFSKYVAVGNSLTAGFTDGALFVAGQENSMPNILAKQFSLAGGGEFKQPLMSDNIGGALLGGEKVLNPRFYFYVDTNPEAPNESGPRLLGTTPDDPEAAKPTTEITNIQTGPFNNMGVPGAKSFHLLAEGYGNPVGLASSSANPYFVRMASSPLTSVIKDVLDQNPTFFSLWAGSNDVLSYALSGADKNEESITDIGLFTQAYTGVLTKLTSNGAKGVVFNIPDVTSIAHFNTVPYNPLDPSNPKFGPLIPKLNENFAALNMALAALGASDDRMIQFSKKEASPVVIIDEELKDLSEGITEKLQSFGIPAGPATIIGMLYGKARQATEEDLLLLPSASVIGQVNTTAVATLMGYGLSLEQAGQLAVNGVSYPLEDKWVLLPTEQEEIKKATEDFNKKINELVKQKDLAFVDVNDELKKIANGNVDVKFDEFFLKDNLVFGGLFSLDGIHPTARGYAYLANLAMTQINAKYGSNLPMVKAENYPTFYPTSLK